MKIDSKKSARSTSLVPKTVVTEDGDVFNWDGQNYVSKSGVIYQEDLQKRAGGSLVRQIAVIQGTTVKKLAKAQRKAEERARQISKQRAGVDVYGKVTKKAANRVLVQQAYAGSPAAQRLLREVVQSVTKAGAPDRFGDRRDQIILAAGTHTETAPTPISGSTSGPWFNHPKPVDPRDTASKAARADTIRDEGSLGR